MILFVFVLQWWFTVPDKIDSKEKIKTEEDSDSETDESMGYTDSSMRSLSSLKNSE